MNAYTDDYLVIEPGLTPLHPWQRLSERELEEAEDRFGAASFAVRPVFDLIFGWLVAPPEGVTRRDILDALMDLDAGTQAASRGAIVDDFHGQAAHRFERLGRLRDLGATGIVLRNERRMLGATARALAAVHQTPQSAAIAA